MMSKVQRMPLANRGFSLGLVQMAAPAALAAGSRGVATTKHNPTYIQRRRRNQNPNHQRQQQHNFSESAVGNASSSTKLLFATIAAGGAVAAAYATSQKVSSPARCEAPTRFVTVAKSADIEDGTMKEVMVPKATRNDWDHPILIARVDGQLYATGASCSHYSAPLAKGVMAKDKMHVVCPWHNAAFDLRTGQPVRGPGLPAIPVYPVKEEDGNIIVEVPLEFSDFEKPKAAKRDPSDPRTFVVVGGGAAGAAAVDSLRQSGFPGKILLLSSEKYLPYDRPVLSKNLGKGTDPSSILLREEEHFQEMEVEVRLGTTVKELDAQAQKITLTTGEEIKYDAALLATGATPRSLPIPGADLPGVLPLRTPQDARNIAEKCGKGKKVLVIGSSFIGMEIAGTLQRGGCEVTVVGMEAYPFERVLGKEVGAAMKKFFEEKGVTFIGSASATSIESKGTQLRATLGGGKKLVADAIILGVGVKPNGSMVKGAEMAQDGSIITDECLKTSAPNLFAAGDIASFKAQSGEMMRVEHWELATSQGRLAAKGMVGSPQPFDQTPFFWTSIFGKNVRYVGHSANFDDVVIEGDVSKLSFVAYYCEKGEIKAVATMMRDPIAVAAGELLRLGKMPTAEEVKSGKVKANDLLSTLQTLNAQKADATAKPVAAKVL